MASSGTRLFLGIFRPACCQKAYLGAGHIGGGSQTSPSCSLSSPYFIQKARHA